MEPTYGLHGRRREHLQFLDQFEADREAMAAHARDRPGEAQALSQVEDRLRGVVAVQGFLEMYTSKLQSEVVDLRLPPPMRLPEPRRQVKGGTLARGFAATQPAKGARKGDLDAGDTLGTSGGESGAMGPASRTQGTKLGFGSSALRSGAAGGGGAGFRTEKEWAEEIFLGRSKPKGKPMDIVERAKATGGAPRRLGVAPTGVTAVSRLLMVRLRCTERAYACLYVGACVCLVASGRERLFD